jgi:hypothetical protein
MIIESKEELVGQLAASWNTLLQVDVALADSIDALVKAHKNIRGLIRQSNDQTGVPSGTRVGPVGGRGYTAQDPEVHGVPA